MCLTCDVQEVQQNDVIAENEHKVNTIYFKESKALKALPILYLFKYYLISGYLGWMLVQGGHLFEVGCLLKFHHFEPHFQ